jgi:hypothetical protein
VGANVSKAGNGKRAARKSQGFELSPPRCLNCQHFTPPAHGVPSTARKAGKPYRPAVCSIGGFSVKAHSICDRWKGTGGEVLEE